MTESGKTAKGTTGTRAQDEARKNIFVDGRGNGDEDDLEKQERAFLTHSEAFTEGLQEAAFICEGYAARLSEGNDHHAEYDAVCECFALIDRRIQEQRQALTGASDPTAQAHEGGSR